MLSFCPPSYPPSRLPSHSGLVEPLSVLQITDLHLFKDPASAYAGCRCNESFQRVLDQAIAEQRCDLILLTGDLINEMDYSLYDYLFKVLDDTQIPFACIAGNHDVTDEVGADLPFHEKQLVAYPADKRLLNQHVIETDAWQIILIDSSDPGKVSGWINEEDLGWLRKQLSENQKHAIICMHHHPVPVESHWLDQHILLNADELWSTIAPFTHVQSILHGHVHQDFYKKYKGVQIFGTPSTCYQFKPHETEFALDGSPPGYRWLHLNTDGTIQTEVKRLN